MKISSPASHIRARGGEAERGRGRETCKIKGERILKRSGKVKKGKAIVACMTWLAPAKYILIKHESEPEREPEREPWPEP